MTDSSLESPDIRQRRVRASLVWLVPITAFLIGLGMVVQSYLSSGPLIRVEFETAEGLEANKTQVRYKNVVIGQVIELRLNEDHTRVVATIELVGDASPFLRDDTSYWVVRPRVGTGGISGIDTLISGAFIAADIGTSEKTRHDFVGLETPPLVTYGTAGKRFTLRTEDLGSLEIGSPVHYRRLPVGQVVSYALAGDGTGVRLDVFVKSPYDAFVTRDTRFWNASGVDVSLGAEGFQVSTQSLSSILSGGIAFQTADNDAPPADEGSVFPLYPNLRQAMAPEQGYANPIRMRFDQTLRGLHADAPVEFLGVPIGRVVSVKLDYDPANMSFPVLVDAVIHPRRLGQAHDKLLRAAGTRSGEDQRHLLMKQLVENGLRAQVRTGNVLTGQLYIALEFDPRAPAASVDDASWPMEIPTIPSSFAKLEEQLQALVDKVSEIPIERMAANLNDSLDALRDTLGQVSGGTLPQLERTLAESEQTLKTINQALVDESPDRLRLSETLVEMQRTLRSMRVFTDYLGRHPESLIRGLGDSGTPGSFKGQAVSRDLNPENPR